MNVTESCQGRFVVVGFLEEWFTQLLPQCYGIDETFCQNIWWLDSVGRRGFLQLSKEK